MEKCCTPSDLEPSLLASDGLGGLAGLLLRLLELHKRGVCLITANRHWLARAEWHSCRVGPL